MTIAFRMVNFTIKGITRAACMVDDAELVKIPMSGPLILAVNHVNFLDAPIFMTHLQPRNVTALVKEETWKNPFMGALFNLWGGIPIKRGEVDRNAYNLARTSLNDGKILAIAPEGTRSKNGRLQIGHPGITMIAVKTNTPILPVAFYGGELIWDNIHRLIRTPFHIRVGKIFTLDPELSLNDRELRQKATDQIMYQVADLLPEKYRGVYSDFTKVDTSFFHFQ
jgi:1-acyl-sn-glycerol-3-phosphate acyltransferase